MYADSQIKISNLCTWPTAFNNVVICPPDARPLVSYHSCIAFHCNSHVFGLSYNPESYYLHIVPLRLPHHVDCQLFIGLYYGGIK